MDPELKAIKEKMKSIPHGRQNYANYGPDRIKLIKGMSSSKQRVKTKAYTDPNIPLTVGEIKYAEAKMKGATNAEAALAAGSGATTKAGLSTQGSLMGRKANVKKVIEEALVAAGATPMWAAKELVKVAAQDDELETKRKAIMDILKLHGWREGEKNATVLEIKNAFFGEARKRVIIDASPESDK